MGALGPVALLTLGDASLGHASKTLVMLLCQPSELGADETVLLDWNDDKNVPAKGSRPLCMPLHQCIHSGDMGQI